MMQAGVCLRQDTETTLPELTEQHRIRLKEEELSALESVHMAESETECAAPGLNTLGPDCVIAHSGVSDVHHTHTSLIKRETDLGSTRTVDHIKTERLDSTELGYVTHLNPDQIKTEADDGGYLMIEHNSELQDVKFVYVKSDEIMCESSESSVLEMVNTAINGTCFDSMNQPESCAREPNWKKEEICYLPAQYEESSHQLSINKENNQTKAFQKNAKRSCKQMNCQRMKVVIESLIINSGKKICSITNEIGAGDEPFMTMQCEKSFLFPTDLNSHLRIHKDERLYKCAKCQEYFGLKSKLNRHLRTCRGEKRHKCTKCEKRFYCKSHLNTHLRGHTGERPYKCSHCGKCFSQKASLENHLRVHTGEKPYKCSHCGKCFSHKASLENHQRIHTGEKPYKCTHCGKCFSQKVNLDSHLRIHTGEKPKKCTQCEKFFRTTSGLKNHLRVHTGEKPYKCTRCEKWFSSKSNLNTHLRIHSGEKPNKCTQCKKCFHRKCDLNRHLRIHPSGQTPQVSSVRSVFIQHLV